MSDILSTCCRLCLSSKDLRWIFVEEPSELRSNLLYLATGVKILPDDGLTQKICKFCTILVNQSLKLRNKSQKTDAELRKLVGESISDSDIQLEEEHDQFTSKSTRKKSKLFEDSKTNQSFDVLSWNHDIKSNIKNENTKELSLSKKIKSRTSKRKRLKLSDIPQNTKLVQKLNEEVNNDYIPTSVDITESELTYYESSDDANCNVLSESKDTEVRPRPRRPKEVIEKYMALAVQPIPNEGPVECNLCGTVIKYKKFFVNHARTHFEPEYPCDQCDKKFFTGSVLKYHQQRMHGAERRKVCPECPFRAVDNRRLQLHMRSVHTGELPFVCNECSKAFLERERLKQHMRTHFGVRNVQCDRCAALFKSRSELASHRNKVHLMSYTYYCYLCPSKFKSVSSTKNHIVKVHGIPREQHPRIRQHKARRLSTDQQSGGTS
ncbi:zinc finger protein 62 homolog [Ostrinia furnacalis]|uniref:zinc finger protein 62 homolog n=1 Tax=Ostrinia furnacalis TaxID=93504 RepID=UPI00103D3E38|nr:zinc finger protein 62 homolog [Ostrinia furnacalis]